LLACDAWVAQNVGAVVLAANAHLHNGDVHALAPEDVEGEDGHELEVGRPVVRGPALAHLNTQQPAINLPTQLCTVSGVADPDPGSGAFLTPGSGMGKKSGPDPGSGSRMNNRDHISEILETIFWAKRLKFFDADLGSGLEKIRIRDPGWKNSDPG
jgi:hypothetical protein